jgi:hypothetical protein
VDRTDTLDVPACEFIEFAIDEATRFEALCAAFAALKHDKEAEVFRDEEDWLLLFDDEALAQFWWPTADEQAAHAARWRAAPVEQRLSDPSYWPPSWDFLSMIDAFKHGEYALVACRMIDGGRARLDFYANAYPYGGTGCMKMLIKAFGFRVIAEEDGTGYRRYEEDAP